MKAYPLNPDALKEQNDLFDKLNAASGVFDRQNPNATVAERRKWQESTYMELRAKCTHIGEYQEVEASVVNSHVKR